MRQSRSHRRKQKIEHRLAIHWSRMLYYQFVAYGVVLAIWLLPIPNPVKLLAVTFHEVSHGVAALLTGGRVFGFAIAPSGAGVTMGIGGNMLLILIAGYIGSCLWGAALYYVSCKWNPKHAMMTLVAVVFGSATLGWANSQTAFFGLGSLVMMLFLFKTREFVQVFFVRLVGSACCLYAPLEILGEVVRFGGAPSVLGEETATDVSQLSQYLGLHAAIVAVTILIIQVAILALLVRWTCTAGARQSVREEIQENKKKKLLIRDIRPESRRYTLR
jgi:hypothetical protein